MFVTVTGIPELPAGANIIGGVDIVTMPEISGTVTANPPTIELTTLSGVKDSAGVNATVAAPAAGQKHVIHMFQFQLEEAPAGAFQRVLLKSGTTELWRFVGTGIGHGVVQVFPEGQELPCEVAEAINLDLAEAKDVGFVIRFRTVSE